MRGGKRVEIYSIKPDAFYRRENAASVWDRIVDHRKVDHRKVDHRKVDHRKVDTKMERCGF